jgi:hypothetical protein
MIPFGPFHPDKAGINVPACTRAVNCIPAVNGYRPLGQLQSGTGAVGETFIVEADGEFIVTGAGAYVTDAGSTIATSCQGAAVVIDNTGVVHTFAGDDVALFKLSSGSEWEDVTRTSGGDYSAGSGERWQFGFAGGLVIAVTIGDDPQKFLLGSSTNFEALGGTPPQARYITTVRDFVVLGGLDGDELTVHWSGLANPEHWTVGTQSCDTQTFQNGGPVRGLVGGETGYVFQAEKVQRMTYAPGSEFIFQFDEVEGGRGLAAPYSLVRLGTEAFYLATDGFYKFSLGGGASTPLGVGKWSKWFVDDIKSGSEATVIGGVDPIGRFIVWAYNSSDSVSSELNRLLIYDWAIDEATIADVSVKAIAQILTQGLTLEGLDAFGDLDTLPFSLDSPVWRGGASLLGMFPADNTMSFLNGAPYEATFETCDGEQPGRSLIKAVRPHVDTRDLTIEIAAREAEGDAVAWGTAESMADTGAVPVWASGFLARARVTLAAGATWSKFTGLTPERGQIGRR